MTYEPDLFDDGLGLHKPLGYRISLLNMAQFALLHSPLGICILMSSTLSALAIDAKRKEKSDRDHP